MPRRNAPQADPPGQDSFLDVVANLVGIMIILIMVVGVATKKAMVDAGPLAAAIPADDAAEPSLDVSGLAAELASLESDLYQNDEKLKREQFEVSYRRGERDQMLAMLTLAEKRLAEKRNTLDASQRDRFDLAARTAAARAELEELERARAAALKAAVPTGVIEHLPTPMAKTVFGKELHFRLIGGRISYVPWDELVDKLKSDAPQKAWKLRDAPKITETIGPIQNYWLKYTLKRTEARVQTGGGVSVQQRVELEKFVMISETEMVGEPVDAALKPGSDFRSRLENAHPGRTTVTVWTYPDSFHCYRDIKQSLFKQGLLTAARPLPDGHPIGGSPEGSRSASQ